MAKKVGFPKGIKRHLYLHTAIWPTSRRVRAFPNTAKDSKASCKTENGGLKASGYSWHQCLSTLYTTSPTGNAIWYGTQGNTINMAVHQLRGLGSLRPWLMPQAPNPVSVIVVGKVCFSITQYKWSPETWSINYGFPLLFWLHNLSWIKDFISLFILIYAYMMV